MREAKKIWALSTQYKKSVMEEMYYSKDDKKITVMQGYRWGKFICISETKPDIVLDDGPHTLPSMVAFINLYLPLLKYDGILAIEDVQDIAWIDELRAATPDALKPYIEVYDLRSVKGRYDDIIFVINKQKKAVHLAV